MSKVGDRVYLKGTVHEVTPEGNCKVVTNELESDKPFRKNGEYKNEGWGK